MNVSSSYLSGHASPVAVPGGRSLQPPTAARVHLHRRDTFREPDATGRVVVPASASEKNAYEARKHACEIDDGTQKRDGDHRWYDFGVPLCVRSPGRDEANVMSEHDTVRTSAYNFRSLDHHPRRFPLHPHLPFFLPPPRSYERESSRRRCYPPLRLQITFSGSGRPAAALASVASGAKP
jgi:hypothetical protein